MSAVNGDKARFGRLRKQKIARRALVRDLRSRLAQAQQAKPAQQSAPVRPAAVPSAVVATKKVMAAKKKQK
jgi:hypothetical protein